MQQFTLYLGSSENDALIKYLLERWSSEHPGISLETRSIHTSPAAAVRFGITHLPALVTGDQLIAQGPLENWVMSFLNRLVVQASSDQ